MPGQPEECAEVACSGLASKGNNNTSPSEAGIALMVHVSLQSLPLKNLVFSLKLLGRMAEFHLQALRHSSFKQQDLSKIIVHCTILLDDNYFCA